MLKTPAPTTKVSDKKITRWIIRQCYGNLNMFYNYSFLMAHVSNKFKTWVIIVTYLI